MALIYKVKKMVVLSVKTGCYKQNLSVWLFLFCFPSHRHTKINIETHAHNYRQVSTHMLNIFLQILHTPYTHVHTLKQRQMDRVGISLFYSWTSVRMCYEYRWQLGLHWQAARQTVEQLFICPNGKYFVTRPRCPKDFLWKGTHIAVAHHIKPPETRLFFLRVAFSINCHVTAGRRH